MRMDQIQLLTPVQRRRVNELKEQVKAEHPAGEIKEFHVVQPDETNELAQYAFAWCEVGFLGDDYDYRHALRVRYTWTISPKGRVEKWDGRRGFNRAVYRKAKEHRSEQMKGLRSLLLPNKAA